MWKIYDSFLGPVKVSPQVALALPGGKLTGNTVYLLGNNNKLHTDFIKGNMRAIWGLVGACQYYQDSRQTLISKPAAGIKRNQVVSSDLIMWKSPESFWNWVLWSAESMAKVLWAAAWKKCETKVVCILVCWGQKYPTRRVRGIKIKAYIIGNKVGPKYYIFIHVIIFFINRPVS